MEKELLQKRSVRNATGQQFQEIIQDLIIRFIICCPEEEHESFERLFFQIEEAHWFYMDEYRQKDPKLPLLSSKQFAEAIFSNCPLLQRHKDFIHQYRSEWVKYKTSVPVCGAIILNQKMDRVLLVRGIGSSARWSFPRGKINKGEPSSLCAVREVREETGLDISQLVNENEFIEMIINEQSVKLFLVVMNVNEMELPPMAPQTRGEIGAIEWLHLEDDILRVTDQKKKKKLWCVFSFARQLKSWIDKQRALNNAKTKQQRVAKEKASPKDRPSKRSGKHNKKIITEIDYQIPAPKQIVKPNGKSQPIAILKRGESLSIIPEIPSSYSPPSHVSVMARSLPEKHIINKPIDSFLNFSFNTDEIVGEFTFVV